MVDYFRHVHPSVKRYTWRRRNPLKQSRLDYIIGPNALLDIINSCSIQPGYRTDHSYVEINLKCASLQEAKAPGNLTVPF